MKKRVRFYRNMNDFRWGSFGVRSGGAWMEVSGKLKKTGKDTIFVRIEFDNGNGMELSEKGE